MITKIAMSNSGTHYALSQSSDSDVPGFEFVAKEITIEEQAAIIESDGGCMTVEENEDTINAGFTAILTQRETVWTKGQYVNDLLFLGVGAGAHKRLDNGEYVEIFPVDPGGTAYTLRRCYMGDVLWSETFSPDSVREPRELAIYEAGFWGYSDWHTGLYGENATVQA